MICNYQTIIKIAEAKNLVVMQGTRFDSVSLAGIAVFSALATLLAIVSQSLGLNFPIIPYLQFDLGEVAIIMAFFIFGPMPAVVSSFVEFVGLLFFGQNIPVGPVLKLFSLLSTVGGMWIGSELSRRLKTMSIKRVVGLSATTGTIVRAAVMTVPNYYLLVFLNSLGYAESLAKIPLSWLGIAVTDSNALLLVLAFTAVFNVLQLAFVVALSYAVLRFQPISNMRVGGRMPWFVSITGEKSAPREAG